MVTLEPAACIDKSKYLSNASVGNISNSSVDNLIEFNGKWPTDEQKNFVKDLRIIKDFITEEEESKLFEEIEPYMKRLHYEFDHWDDAIHGFRETERKQWYPHNRQILERVRQVAFDGAIMPYVHILDLAEKGVIKPHVDSTRYCGTTISGMSLLSNCVMRLIRVDETKYRQTVQDSESTDCDKTKTATQTESTDDSYRNQPKATIENNFYADVLLPRRSLYIMSHSSRYNFTHEILSNEFSKFHGQPIHKGRRISIICRNEP
ncbi:alpha-ketoglutarate-dependent dioxygenase alkB homolog 7, mitochondrial-like [Teleopsis dalmanni]|uniref:alpha-ketoglutarate-dependent dioxygenase alkB homolog 7, mitochondrial-like n=1 Tax=Teleopsis dalmanni TaxID=139649 RepID=UPI0018CFDEFF|nr:alpha-ketoglutarate-dependent dioxygenase alkB homolog 7, mitochondrial-like [Teleopsis dalmanni]